MRPTTGKGPVTTVQEQNNNRAIGDDAILRVMVLSTGGTIEKVYQERDGSLRNRRSPFLRIVGRLRHPTVRIRHQTVLQKDSLDLTEDDRRMIGDAVQAVDPEFDAVLIIHGTDTLAVTGEYLQRRLDQLSRPVVLTGAMRPFEFRDTDAFQNVHEALVACRLLPPGVYVAMHSKVLRFPDVVKDRRRMTFVSKPPAASRPPDVSAKGAAAEPSAPETV